VLNSSVPVASDIDGTINANGYALVAGPGAGNGSLTFNPNGSYSFNPGTDFDALAVGVTRNVTFTYTATDNNGTVSAPATVTITVTGTNDAPVANAVSASGLEDPAARIQVNLSGSDIDGSISSYTIDSTPANGSLYSAATGGSALTVGTVVSGPVYFVPTADWSGDTSFQYHATDNSGANSSNATASISITSVADAIPGSAVSVVIGTPVSNIIDFGSNISGLDGQSNYTFPSGITLSTGDSGKVFDWSTGSLLSVQTSGDNGDNRILGSDQIGIAFPSGMQYLALKVKNAADDTVLVRSGLEVGDLTSGTLSGTITSSAGTTVSSANLKVDLVLEVLNGGTTSTVTLSATVNSGGTWSVSYSGVTGTITKATAVSYIDGDLFNQGGNTSANVTYSISSDMQSLSIAQDTSRTFSAGQNNNGFQIEYVAVDPNPSGLLSYSYPVDIYALLQDTVGTSETISSLTLSELPAGSTISVVRADGTYQEIAPNAQGVYDLSTYTSLLSTATTTTGTDKIYLITSSALPSGFAPTLTLVISDDLSTATSIIGGSADSTFSGGGGNDYISGGAGSDNISGADGNDTLDGGIGNDILIGGTGDDILLGNDGSDVLRGGVGNDQLTGGIGADLFIWNQGDTGNDTITDFNVGEGDRIDLRDLLQGENDSNIFNYLRVDTSTSTLEVSTTGNFAGGVDASIKLENGGAALDLSSYGSTSSQIVSSLIAGADPIVKVDN
uniref:type I secretion C-terminal target domain-containing protein n=1 Tax=Pseudomonas sp. 2FE TaxID=2502190 RepID=UPI0010F87E48